MNAVQDERDRLRAALSAFYEANERLGLKSRNKWAVASGLSAGTINPVLNGTANKRMSPETYFKLAEGASKLLKRKVTVEELQGLPAPIPTVDLSPAEHRLLMKYRKGTDRKRSLLDNLADELVPDHDEGQERQG